MYSRKLIDYLPEFLRDVMEFDAVLTLGIQPDISELFDATETAMNDQFIDTATEYGISRWEKMLKIIPKSGQTLDDRRFTIKTRLTEQPPYTLRVLKQKLAVLCNDPNGYSVEVDSDNFIFKIRVALTSRTAFDDVCELVERLVPMNMIIDASLMYNQHKLYNNVNRHGYLSAFTHHELREKVW